MTMIRKSLYVVPLVIASFLSEMRLEAFFQILVGGVWLWIPYWVVVWSFDVDDAAADGDAIMTQGEHRNISVAHTGTDDASLGFKLGPYGAGWYSGKNRYD